MSNIRRETPAKPPKRDAGGGDVRMKKEKISKDRINVEKTSVEQKEGCPNNEGIKKSNRNERSGMYRVIKPPPWHRVGGEEYPLQQWVWRGGEMIRKASEDPRAEGKGGGLMSVTNRIIYM